MTMESCAICGRENTSTDERCACGASLDWLRHAPKMLREKLGRAARYAVGTAAATSITACGGTACALSVADAGCATDACAADANGAMFDSSIDSGGAVCADAGCAADIGILDASTPDAAPTEDASPDTDSGTDGGSTP